MKNGASTAKQRQRSIDKSKAYVLYISVRLLYFFFSKAYFFMKINKPTGPYWVPASVFILEYELQVTITVTAESSAEIAQAASVWVFRNWSAFQRLCQSASVAWHITLGEPGMCRLKLARSPWGCVLCSPGSTHPLGLGKESDVVFRRVSPNSSVGKWTDWMFRGYGYRPSEGCLSHTYF